MRKFGIRIGTMVSSIAMVAAFSITAHAADQATLEKGKQLAFERAKGNCLACHFIEGGNSPGNIGPGLVAMKSRFPDKAKLRAQIWDATAANPNTMMPPFGLNNALSDDEVDAITEFVYTL